MNQYNNFGQTLTSSPPLVATLVFFGCIAGFVGSGVANAISDGYFLAREKKKGVTYKTIAKRNAILGGAVGAVGAGIILTNPGVLNK